MAPHQTATRAPSSPRTSRRPVRLVGSTALLLTSTLAPISGGVAQAAPAPVDTRSAGAVTAPTSYTIRGQGFGHGHGMSQWGAYGAARQGLTYDKILAFYYPGTTPVLQKKSSTVRVWITADSDGVLRLPPAAGLAVRDADDHSLVLPTGADYRAWRIGRSGSGYKLTHLTAGGAWKTLRTPLSSSTWTAFDDAGVVGVGLPGGSTAYYRGTLSLAKHGTSGRTVNTVPMESYLRGVVPSEMPTSWAIEAVKAQSVAARTFVAKSATYAGRGSGYDVCDTDWCQVYKPYAVVRHGHRVVNDTSRGNAAIKATAREVLTYDGSLALTQFGASNGGWATSGNLPYLVAEADPYDQAISNSHWSRTITAATLHRIWPSAGTVTALTITRRDKHGRWGGRPTQVAIVGSKRTVTVSGGSFAATFGFGSTLYTVVS